MQVQTSVPVPAYPYNGNLGPAYADKPRLPRPEPVMQRPMPTTQSAKVATVNGFAT